MPMARAVSERDLLSWAPQPAGILGGHVGGLARHPLALEIMWFMSPVVDDDVFSDNPVVLLTHRGRLHLCPTLWVSTAWSSVGFCLL